MENFILFYGLEPYNADDIQEAEAILDKSRRRVGAEQKQGE
jgi:hypothetical protein